MLLCDDEPSPESSDQVFFFCDEQANNINNKCDDSKDSKDNNKIINNKSYSKSSSIDQSVIKSDNNQVVIINNNKQKVNKNSHVFNRKRNNNKKCVDNITTTTITTNKTTDVIAPDDDDNDDDDDEINQNLTNKPIGLETSITNDAATKTQNEATQTNNKTVLVKIQVENCCQCPDNSISFISQEKETSPVTDNDSLCKINKKKKTVAVQVNFNSIDSVGESNCLKISKVRCCNKATQRVQSLNWGNKCNDIGDNDINSWSGKNMKNQSTNAGTGVICVNTGDNKPKLHDKSNSVDRASIKSKKFSNAVSPLKQFNRSSLTIGPDKITINQNLHSYNNIRPSYPANLSKYSPCASRLAASSKILGNTSPTALSPDSPLHGARPKSPRLGDSLSNSNSPKSGEKVTLQASLSLNINQLKKPNTTPRSRSVGDSCVTSPTGEATTLSYSPTGTEIISLDEIGQHHRHNHHHHHQQQQQQQKYKHKHQRSSSVSLSAPDLKALHTDRLSMPIDIRKANLETKC